MKNVKENVTIDTESVLFNLIHMKAYIEMFRFKII